MSETDTEGFVEKYFNPGETDNFIDSNRKMLLKEGRSMLHITVTADDPDPIRTIRNLLNESMKIVKESKLSSGRQGILERFPGGYDYASSLKLELGEGVSEAGGEALIGNALERLTRE